MRTGRDFLRAAGKGKQIFYKAGKANVLLKIQWKRHHLSVTTDERRDKLKGKQLAITHVKMPQVIPAVCSANFPKVNNTRVTPIFLVNLGGVEVSMCQIALLTAQPGVMARKYSFQQGHF